jgi:hypothetical protein
LNSKLTEATEYKKINLPDNVYLGKHWKGGVLNTKKECEFE